MTTQFDFGSNWADFSANALTPERADQAKLAFQNLLAGIELEGADFLDIGFGQGLSLLSAVELGAHAVGCDINPLCARVLQQNSRFFPQASTKDIPLIIGSILDAETQEKVLAENAGGYDIVHAWGVLHHTGDMKRAISIAAGLVGKRGHLVISIYNRHWSSPAWKWIKRLYCASHPVVQRLLVGVLYPAIWIAKLAATRRSPGRKERGMDFYYDVVDWVGGFPYEYATAEEVIVIARTLGFEHVRGRQARVPTGCNEFVFRKISE